MKSFSTDNLSTYPLDPWKITEESFSSQNTLLSETIFALGNGYIGIRGSFEEGLDRAKCRTIEGTYLNGFYESVPIPHAERGYGYAVNTQTMLNVTDSKIIEVFLDGERFSLEEGEILRFKRTLDFRQAILFREVVWRSPSGKEVEFVFKRLVSFARRHLMAFQLKLTPLNFSGSVTIMSSMNGDVDNHTHEEEDPRFSASLGGLGLKKLSVKTDDTGTVMLQNTKRSGLTLACAMGSSMQESVAYSSESKQSGALTSVYYKFAALEQNSYTFEKYVSYYTSRDYPVEDLASLALQSIDEAKNAGFEELGREQADYCRRFWDKAGITIEGDPKSEQGIRFNLFHLLQAAGSNGKTGIAAKGLTSEGYDGHYFWDTEIYMTPFFSALVPAEARKLLEYRYSILDHARSRARELSHPRGALYPWRTIAGEEGSSYYPAGTAQYHINAAIAYAISKYIDITGEYNFMLQYGAEIIFETARLWEDLGAYIPTKENLFCYNEVTGPDEYTALVNNNCYTNLMARWHLQYAYDTALFIKKNHPAEYRRITEKIKLEEVELKAWLKAAENMYIPFDPAQKVHPQDDGFFDKEVWDFASTPANNYPLLLYYHPLVIYRYQVCKQPDVILAQLLLEDAIGLEQKRRNYNYYQAITTHDSSLSPSIFSIAASELGFSESAKRFFDLSVRLDLDNIMKDTHYGIHLANMAGSWLSVVHGFGGMRTRGGRLSFDPYMPEKWQGYKFKVQFRGNLLEVEVKKDQVTYILINGEMISFSHREKSVVLRSGEKVNFRL